MPQAKFSLTATQIDFINRHEKWGYPDKSAMVRDALEQMRARLARERLQESAKLYAEVYAEDEELRCLTDAALEGWPE